MKLRTSWYMAIVGMFLVTGVAEAEAGQPELFYGGFYRAENQKVVLQIPKLGKAWRTSYAKDARGTNITLMKRGSTSSLSAYVRITCFSPAIIGKIGRKDKELAKALLALMLQALPKTEPHLKPIQKAAAFESASGVGISQGFAGKLKNGNVEIAFYSAVADGATGVLFQIRSRKSEWDRLQKELVQPLTKSLRVGSKVPRLSNRKPKTVLDGVYESMYSASRKSTSWKIFDKRGYVSSRSPADESALDLDAIYQRNPKWISSYDISGGKLISTNLVSGKKSRYSFERKADGGLVLDGTEHFRRDGKLGDDIKLDGHYRSEYVYSNSLPSSDFTYSDSKDYHFRPDGRFSYDSRNWSASTHNQQGRTLGPNEYPGWVNMSNKSPKKTGSYRIVADRLLLDFGDGLRLKKVVFSQYQKNGKPQRLYIGGSSYRLQK